MQNGYANYTLIEGPGVDGRPKYMLTHIKSCKLYTISERLKLIVECEPKLAETIANSSGSASSSRTLPMQDIRQYAISNKPFPASVILELEV